MVTNSNYSLADLQHMLSERKTELDDLKREQAKLEKNLSAVKNRIEILTGKKDKRSKVHRVKRPRNQVSLHKTILELLGKNKAGLLLDDIKKQILANGYKTTSKNFRNVVYQTAYHSQKIVQNKKTGVYLLKR